MNNRLDAPRGQILGQVQVDEYPKTGHDLSMSVLTTGKIGTIYPTQALPVNYGDSIQNKSSAVVQFQPLAVPMMANMTIKQEHFYVPYNCVWSNWDNFISGGEENDFNTPPPLTSLRSIIYMINSLFGVETYNSGVQVSIPFGITKDVQSGHIISFLNSSVVDEYIDKYKDSQYNEFAKQYEIEDLSKFMPESLKKALEFFYHSIDNSQQSTGKLNLAVPLQYYLDDNEINFNDYNAKPLEYEKDILDSLNNAWSAINQSDPLHRPIILPQAIGYVQEFYNFFKPLIGPGSYFDLLGMGVFTFEDFLLAIYYELYDTYTQFESLPESVQLSTSYGVLFVDPKYINNEQVHVLNLRAQYLTWYNNYRDQLLELNAMKPRTADDALDYELILMLMPRQRCWQKDTFTTALTTPATADVAIPTSLSLQVFSQRRYEMTDEQRSDMYHNQMDINSIKFMDGEVIKIPSNYISGFGNQVIDTGSNTNGFSLHMLDAARRAQKFLKKALFIGNRIQDFVYSQFHVKYLDARLRLPELLATSKQLVKMETLVNNTTTQESIAGDKAGFAYGNDEGNFFDRYCEEAGVILSFFTIMPDTTYTKLRDKQYSRLDRFDYPFPDFATLGMDGVFQSELAYQAVGSAVQYEDTDTTSALEGFPIKNALFGYQGRYYPQKSRVSTEHGEFLTTQNMYTFGRSFNPYMRDGMPKLNAYFVHCFPPLDMFVMDNRDYPIDDYWRAEIYHDTKADTELPKYSIQL